MSAGKGDRIRPFNRKKWDEGYERAFGKWRQYTGSDPNIEKMKRAIREVGKKNA